MRHPPTTMNSLRNLALMLTDTTNLADGAPTNDS